MPGNLFSDDSLFSSHSLITPAAAAVREETDDAEFNDVNLQLITAVSDL